MFIGHFAVALCAKRLTPRTSLGTLLAAAQLSDLLWPALLLLGLETVRVAPGDTAFTPLEFASYPWTHSLFTVALWAIIFALLYRWRTGSALGTWVVGVLVLSHWLLDFVSHRPDLPLAPGAMKVGLGLWNSVPATLACEGLLFAAGVSVYTTGTRPRNRTGRVAWWALVVVLVGFYVGDAMGSPPPSATAVAVAGLLLWLFIPWAAWIDRNRSPSTDRKASARSRV